MEKPNSCSGGLEWNWLGRTHFRRAICYRLDNSALPHLDFPSANDLKEDLVFTRFSISRGFDLDASSDSNDQITQHVLSSGIRKRTNSLGQDSEARCASTSTKKSPNLSGTPQSCHHRSRSLPRIGGANDDDGGNYNSEDCKGGYSGEKRHDGGLDVTRGASWSEYFVGTGDEHAVEEAEEWVVDFSELFLGHKFASGAYSRLYLGKYKETAVAVKILRQPDDNEEVARRLERQFISEVSVLSRVQHPNVVKFIGACRKPPVCCVITEYLPLGSVRTYVHNQQPLSLPFGLVIGMALDIARGMEYLHSQGIIHRDLKSENLVIAEDLCVKITDFGVACFESAISNMTEDVGTYRWMAPEMISNKHFSKKSDVYSFGIVLWELLTGQIPFEELSPVQAAFAVVHKHARPPLSLNCPSALGHLMHQCWSTDPHKRPEFSEVVEVLEGLKESARLKRNLSTWQGPHRHTNMFFHCFRGSVSKRGLSII